MADCRRQGPPTERRGVAVVGLDGDTVATLRESGLRPERVEGIERASVGPLVVGWSGVDADSVAACDRPVLAVGPAADAPAAMAAGVAVYLPRETDGFAQRLADHVRRLVAEAATTRRDRFETLFDAFPEPVIAYRFDEDTTRVHRANAAFGETFGVDPEDVVGRRVGNLVVPDGELPEAKRIDEAVRGYESVEREVTRTAADGPRQFRLQNVPRETDDAIDGFAIYADVTETKRRQRELERRNERLDEFASVVSHDLRNPLSVADGNVELAARMSDDPAVTDRLERAADAVERMGTLIDDLLTVARRGAAVETTESVDLAELAPVAWQTTGTGELSLSLADPPEVLADRGRLQQLLENLFRNAAEHAVARESDGRAGVDERFDADTTTGDADATGGDADATTADADERAGDADGTAGEATKPTGDADGGGGATAETQPAASVTVTVGATENGFYVADDGRGFDLTDPSEAFEAGVTTSEDGTGFGLRIVREVCDAHGWTVTATDSEAGGARFEITGVETPDGA